MNCLSKNLITHFVRYFEKKKNMKLKLSINRVIIKEHFYGRKSALKAFPRTLFNFGK